LLEIKRPRNMNRKGSFRSKKINSDIMLGGI